MTFTPELPLRTTEMVTLATCEERWRRRYLLGTHEEPSQAMGKGTLWHAVWDEWWVQEDGYRGITESNILARIPDEKQENITDQAWDDVRWMIRRYDQWRGGSYLATDWRVIDQEVEWEADIGGVLFQGRVDDVRVHLPTNQVYVGECKTMIDWRRLDILEVDPQVSNYVRLAQANGYPGCVGVMYDAAKTYRWKRDEHPPSDSFRELTILRDTPQLEAAQVQVQIAATRRAQIATSNRAIANISANTCMGCSFRGDCWEDLAFPEEPVEWVE